MPNSTRASNAAIDERIEHVLGRLRVAKDMTSGLGDVLDIAIEAAGADMGTLQRYDSAGDCLKVVASRGFSDSVLRHFAVVRRDSHSTCAAALAQRMRVVVNDVATSYLFVGTRELEILHEAGVAAVHSTPLIAPSGRLWGVFSTHFRKPQPKSEYNHALLDRLSVRLADHLEAVEARMSQSSNRRP